MFQSTKIFDGFSCCFRQWKAETTHCKYLHGYGVSFKVKFEGELDHRNWVWDFGGMKRAKTKIDGKSPKEWMDYMFDHTIIVAADDPYINTLQQLDNAGIAHETMRQLGILEQIPANAPMEMGYPLYLQKVKESLSSSMFFNSI